MGEGRVPLVAHIIFRLDFGGLENGLVNLINQIPADRYRHAIICLTTHSEFRERIKRENVEVFDLNKAAGKDLGMYARLWRLLRSLRPDVVHTRNLATLDSQFVAALAGVKHRIHGEHGWDMIDLDGSNRKYNMLRRAASLVVQRYIPMSRDLDAWLRSTVGISPGKITQIYNGVDTTKFHAADDMSRAVLPNGFANDKSVIVGTVGRMAEVKDQLTLVRAFVRMREASTVARANARLVLIGEGSLRSQARNILEEAGALDTAWLPGARSDVAELLRAFDIFVLPSLNEGISNTILEAMATGLPVVATRVGGNPELVESGHNGVLTPPSDPAAMADSILAYVEEPALTVRHGQAGRSRVMSQFSLTRMVDDYLDVYDGVFTSQGALAQTG